MTGGCNHSNAALTRAVAEPGLSMALAGSLQEEEKKGGDLLAREFGACLKRASLATATLVQAGEL